MKPVVFCLLLCLFAFCLPQPLPAFQTDDERTVAEFREYVAGRLRGVDDDKLDLIAEAADTDSDGIISEEEFENRMEVIREVMSGDASDSPMPEKENQPAEKEEEKTAPTETAPESADSPESEELEASKAKPKEFAESSKPYGPIKDRADVLIVTNTELADSWKAFADWKTGSGRPARIVTIEWIDEEFEGDDIQQKIRACCLKHIADMGTNNVILGGDSDRDAGVVPDRDTDHSDFKMLPYDDIPTDLYYISEKDWDANGDGIYGKFADDMDAVAYTNPNACIGRIPLREPADVVAYTEKVIAYETDYPTDDFANRMVYTCPEGSAYPKLETSLKLVAKAWLAGNVSKFFANETPWDEDEDGDYDLTPENWAEMINDGQAAKLHMHGHGLLPLWVLEDRTTFDHSMVATLKNKNAYPIITTVSCFTGQYDNRKDPSVTEAMLREPDAGAIAILAPSREGVPFMMKRSDMRLMMTEGKMDGTTESYTKFWLNALEGEMTLGECFRKVKADMAEFAHENDGFHMLQCELNLLGDPTLNPHAVPPKNFAGSVSIKDGQLEATGFEAGAMLCVWDGADDYQMVKLEKDSATVKLNSEGAYTVTASAMGYNTWVSEGVTVGSE